jgi:Tfp pilus assembly protein PilN
LDKLNAAKAIVNGELNNLKTEQGSLKKQIEGFEYIAKKSKEFNEKLDIMQKIVDRRFLAVSGLDQIQEVIPEEVWLKEIQFRKDDFTIRGVSTTNKQIQNFAEELEGTNLFSKVVLDRAEEDRSNNSKLHSRRKFVIVSTLK